MVTPVRIVPVLVLALVLIVAIGAIKPRTPLPGQGSPVDEDHLFLAKTHERSRHDIVILGDSRALRGIAPAELESNLTSHSALNLAYNSGGLNPEIYALADRRLDTRRGGVVVLAVTPLTLLRSKAANPQLAQFRSVPPDEVFLKTRLPRFVKFFEPLTAGPLVVRAFDIQLRSLHFESFHRRGWIATNEVPPDTAEALPLYAANLKDKRVDPELIGALVAQTRRWTANGTHVFACRPPTTRSLRALEDSLTGFDEKLMSSSFIAGGGHWLAFPMDDYATYDGSHLREAQARRFSRDLGARIAAILSAEAQ